MCRFRMQKQQKLIGYVENIYSKLQINNWTIFIVHKKTDEQSESTVNGCI